MNDMTTAREFVRKLRLVINLQQLSIQDYHLLEPIYFAYSQTKNEFAINEKQGEMINTIYDKHYEN